ncbi:MAG: hypothetical protein ACHBN1_08900 [Heteroscytonema crispum UTEX LB 1556]
MASFEKRQVVGASCFIFDSSSQQDARTTRQNKIGHLGCSPLKHLD